MRLAARILAWVAVGMLAMTALALAAMSWLLEPSIHTAQLNNLRGMGPTLDRVLHHEPRRLDDPDDLAISCDVAGERRQEDRTSGMIFSVTELVVFLSRYCTLEPGDPPPADRFRGQAPVPTAKP